MFNKKKKIKSNLFNFIFLKRKLNLKKLLIISAFALIVVGISIFSAYSFPGSSGGVIIDSGIVAFTEIGEHTWIVPDGVTEVDVLIIAGGGGGGSRNSTSNSHYYASGGGGGGGIIYETIQISSNEYSVVVGEGGIGSPAGGPTNSNDAQNGGNSSAFGLTAIGGGAGGSGRSNSGFDGGAGGGSARGSDQGALPGTGTPEQGNNGGAATSNGLSGNNLAGGGGGGGDMSGSAGNGGNGAYYGDIFGNIYGDNGYFSGGGGGSTGAGNTNIGLGGVGGGGSGGVGSNGSLIIAATNGLKNTGGGGGAGGSSQNVSPGGNGGSGIVLIKYRVDSNLQVSSLNSGLVGHWTLDQDKYNPSNFRVTDNTPYENHGTNYGATFTTDRFGKAGGAMSFNGSSNYIDCGEVDIENNNTWSWWMKWTGGGSGLRGIIARGTVNNTYSIRLGSGNHLEFRIFGRETLSSNITPSTDWEHWTIVKTNRNYKFYRNGEFIIERNASFDLVNQANLFIGYYENYAYFPGLIDDVRIYNRTLSEQEISQLYSSYKPKVVPSLQRGLVLDMPLTSTYTKSSTPGSEIMTDRTPYSNDGQNIGATITSDGAMFDGGSGTRISANTPLIPTSWTISVWLMKRSHSLTSYPIFLSFWLPYLACNGSTSPFRLSYTSSTGQVHTSGTTIPVLNEWYHVVATSDSDGTRLYVNGQFERANTTHISTNTGGNFNIGRHGTGDTYRIDGGVSNLRIYNRALSAQEVELLYARGR
jgi:hypothetical protein